MTMRTGRRRSGAGQGFTLIELLLATALLLLLSGAMVFNFGTFRQGAELNEAALQMEGLLHFARAHAAQTGRRVQVNFEEQIDSDFFLALGGLRMLWEPDPLTQPGVFQPVVEASELVRRVTEAVMIESVQPLDANGREWNVASTAAEGTTEFLPDEWLTTTPPINFYPDGSSDSAQIIITSWDYDDPRRLAVRLLGVTGTIRSQWLSDPLDLDLDAAFDELETDAADASTSEFPSSTSAAPSPAAGQ